MEEDVTQLPTRTLVARVLRTPRGAAHGAAVLAGLALFTTALAPPGDSRHLVPYQVVYAAVPVLVLGAFLLAATALRGPSRDSLALGAAAYVAVGILGLALLALRPGSSLTAAEGVVFLAIWPAAVLGVVVIAAGNALGLVAA